MSAIQELASRLTLGSLLDQLTQSGSPYQILAHWQQSEFHHDLVLQVQDPQVLPGNILVISTDCNGGVLELFCLAEIPDRWALWHHRCPENPEFSGTLPLILERIRTPLWRDPCQLLTPEAPSEFLPAFVQRQRGGGWIPVGHQE